MVWLSSSPLGRKGAEMSLQVSGSVSSARHFTVSVGCDVVRNFLVAALYTVCVHKTTLASVMCSDISYILVPSYSSFLAFGPGWVRSTRLVSYMGFRSNLASSDGELAPWSWPAGAQVWLCLFAVERGT